MRHSEVETTLVTFSPMNASKPQGFYRFIFCSSVEQGAIRKRARLLFLGREGAIRKRTSKTRSAIRNALGYSKTRSAIRKRTSKTSRVLFETAPRKSGLLLGRSRPLFRNRRLHPGLAAYVLGERTVSADCRFLFHSTGRFFVPRAAIPESRMLFRYVGGYSEIAARAPGK